MTSFSVLFAKYKGDIQYFIKSAKAIDQLTVNSRVLIAEACTHAPLAEDIGRVKIPAMLKKNTETACRWILSAVRTFRKNCRTMISSFIAVPACLIKNMFNSEWNRQKGRNTDDELRNCYRIYERDTGAYYILKSKIKSECSTHLLDSLQ